MFILYFLLFAFFTFIVVTVAGFVYLDWWQALLLSVATMMSLVYLGKVYIRWKLGRLGSMFQDLFKIKSQVLRGATIEVHAVTHAAVPQQPLLEHHPDPDDEGEADEDADEEDEQPERPTRPLAWYCIDVTIIPGSNPGPMQHWDVSDLRLIAGNARVPENLHDSEEEDDYELHEVEIEAEGSFRMADEGKYLGPQRLRFIAGLPLELREVKFRYYFEQFGRIALPPR